MSKRKKKLSREKNLRLSKACNQQNKASRTKVWRDSKIDGINDKNGAIPSSPKSIKSPNCINSQVYFFFFSRSNQLVRVRMQKSSSPHTKFFASLKHLEKRLKLENHPAGPSTLSRPPPPPPPLLIEHQEIIKSTQQTVSLGTPIYLNYNQSPTTNTNASNLQEESEAPQEFLSRSPDFPPTHHSLPHEAEVQQSVDQAERLSLDDDIELLMQLLRLSDSEELNERAGVNGVGCDDGFYDKIVGVKGPKSVKEVERLDRWIKHFLNGEKKEPFRLAHLLLGKAAFMHSDDDCDGFGGFVFPSTIDEFLQNDPPID